MKKGFHDWICLHYFLLLFLVIHLSKSFEFQCPSPKQWIIRAKSQCLIADGYICLFDENRNTFVERCDTKSYVQQAGFKFAIVGSLDKRKCESIRYQPFTFSTNGMSACIFEKTSCIEKGQIIFSNGSSDTDRQCRCDYTQGYDFITKPEHGCYCVPSKEDCSCYKKRCTPGFILSPDYKCINLTNWNSKFTCEFILPNHRTDTSFPPHDNNLDDGVTAQERNEIIILSIAVVVTILFTLIIVQLTLFCLPKMEEGKHVFRENIELKLVLAGEVIPQSIRDAQTNLKEIWRKRYSPFVKTTAFHAIEESIKQEQCIMISGSMGCGKSSTAFHCAMALEETEKLDVMIISNQDDIFKYAITDKMQLFLIDDVFGMYSVSDYKSKWWKHNAQFVQNILKQNDNLKLIMTSRLHILNLVNPKLPTFCHLNLISEDLALTFKERKMIGRRYLQDDMIDTIGEKVIMSASFFPALCAKVPSENKENIIDYFTLPVEYISSETIDMRKSGDLFYLSLTILIIFDNKVKKDFFNESSHQYDEMLHFLSKEIGFNRHPLKSLLFSHYIALKDSYVSEKKEYFECLHENLFNLLVLSIGPCMLHSLIVYGESSFLNERTVLETTVGYHPKLTIVIPNELQNMYFERMLSDIKSGNHDFFKSHEHSLIDFRESFITYLQTHLKEGELKKSSHASTVLHVVSSEGFVDYVEFSLGLEKNIVNQKDNLGQTALHKACMNGHITVATVLLNKGATIDTSDNNKCTALDIACAKNLTDLVKLLLSRGAHIRQKQSDLRSSLHIVCSNGNKELAELLLEKKAKVNDQDSHGQTPLHLACKKRHIDIVELLVNYKPDLNILDDKYRTALYIAVDENDINIVDSLLQLNPKLDIFTEEGRVALHCACQHGSVEITNMLIKEGANINIGDKQGSTPLYVACENGHLNVVELLLSYNANVQLRNAIRNTPLLIACENKFTEIVKLLLNKQADANCKSDAQMTPLLKACISDQMEIVSLLMAHEASVNEPDTTLRTPLFLACLNGNCNLAAELLKSKPCVNKANNAGLTPLHIACMQKRKDLVLLLIDSGADIQKEDEKGMTPLEIASLSGNKCIKNALINKLNLNLNV